MEQLARPPVDTVPVAFKVECRTQPGDNVLITGNLATELGGWDLNQAVAMTTSPETYPTWSAVVPLPVHVALEFKFVLQRADGSFEWEQGDVNRVNVFKTPVKHSPPMEVGWHVRLWQLCVSCAVSDLCVRCEGGRHFVSATSPRPFLTFQRMYHVCAWAHIPCTSPGDSIISPPSSGLPDRCVRWM